MLRVMSWNTLFGGFDGADGARFERIARVVQEADPDILLLQELRGYLAEGGRRLHTAEQALGRRGFVAEAPATGQHTGIFVRPGIEPIAFEADGAHFHHAAAIGRFRVPGMDAPVIAASVHLCPNAPEVRLREVSYLYNLAVPEELVVVGGDFNSLAPDDPEPDGLGDLPPRFRSRYADDDGRTDRRSVGRLLRVGFADVAAWVGSDLGPTVPAAGFTGTEFVPFRCDFLLATPALVGRATSYQAIRSEETGRASDHYPIIAEFSA